MVEDFFSSRRRRDRSLIIAKILDVAREGAFKTQIMYGVSLSFAQLNEYLSLLLDLNLLEAVENSKKTIYKTTDRGLRYLQSYREIEKLLKRGKRNNIKDANSLHLVKRGTRVTLL
ncbi:MAG: winged helix-turn-helix domain-containing protein [Candidatus Bathyarchaeia archaeon]